MKQSLLFGRRRKAVFGCVGFSFFTCKKLIEDYVFGSLFVCLLGLVLLNLIRNEVYVSA